MLPSAPFFAAGNFLRKMMRVDCIIEATSLIAVILVSDGDSLILIMFGRVIITADILFYLNYSFNIRVPGNYGDGQL